MQRITIPFSEVLEALGALDTTPVEIKNNWELYKVRYPTPAGFITANYLSLSFDCPLQEASSRNLSRWKEFAGGASFYTAIVTNKSRLTLDLHKTASTFGARTATTSRELLFQNVISAFMPRLEEIEEVQYFIEPDIGLPSGETMPALSYLVGDLLADRTGVQDQVCADILVAAAGLGKTTLARAIAYKILKSKRQAIPILVESAQWQNLINLTLPNILNAAVLQLIPEAVRLTNSKLFQLLVREQLLFPIFDGFDELCLHPNSNYNPTTLITELLDLVGDTGARILITTRETFWEKYSAGTPAERIKCVKLQGFSNDQRKQFFTKRLALPEERDLANRIAREVGERLYEGDIDRKPLQADRASGVPLLLELVALYVDGNPSATFAPTSRDPLGPLLVAVCERENARQKLKISSEKQMMIFEELFRDFPDDIARADLAFYVQYTVPDVTKDALARFESHAFFSPGRDIKARFETLKVYFVARWLANRLEASITEPTSEPLIAELLERNSTGNTDVFDFLISRFLEMDRNKARSAIAHAFKMLQSRPHSDGAISALFHLAQRLAHRLDNTKSGRTSLVLNYLGVAGHVQRLSVQGQISGLDLSGLIIVDCNFKDVEFHNCTFSESTQFQKSRFEGALSFENCKLPGNAKLIDCTLSDESEREWDKQAGRAAKSIVNPTVAKEALREILRRFIGPFGFSSMKEADRNSGLILRNPCGDLAWEELIRAKILEHHRISGVSGGGLNIVDNQDVRHEVRSFLDNAALGPRLQRVVETILKHA